MLICCADLLVPHLGPICQETFTIGIYLAQWCDLVTIILRKLAKPDYTALNAHWPIPLNQHARQSTVCVCHRGPGKYGQDTQAPPENYFGSHPGRTTTDSIHYVTKYIKDAWRKGEVISTLFLDINSAFHSMVLDQLVNDMQHRGIPMQYTDWIKCRVCGRRTTLKFDRYESELLEIVKGLNQGCLLSGITFQFYNVDLIDVQNLESREEAMAFMNDALLLA